MVIDFVDAGGMGAIYQAFDPELNRPVAIKILSVAKERSQDSLEAERAKNRMLREAQALAQLTHPNVVTVYDVGVHQDSIFIAMEFVAGSDLNVWREENKPSRDEVLAKVIDAGRGLSAAHQAGIVHRDFKPANVIVCKDGRVRILDFGLAMSAETSAENASSRKTLEKSFVSGRPANELSKDMLTGPLTEAGSVVGTTYYMAPEQMERKHVDERSDQFAFCVSLYEALYGCRPFKGKHILQLFSSIKRAAFVRPKDKKIHKRLDDVILRGLTIDSQDRFASMDKLIEALASDPDVLHKELRDKRKRTVTVVGSISLSLLIAGSGMWFASTKGSRLCKGAEDKLVGVWDPAAKAKVKKAFLGTKRYFAANTYERVAKIMDDRVAQWTAMRSDACLATHVRGEQSERMLDLRMRCLNRKLSEMDALGKLFAAKTDGEVLNKAVAATLGLSAIDQCADEEFLMAEMPPPEDPIMREKVESLRGKLDEVKAFEKSGKYQEGFALASQLLEIAKKLDYQPIEAEALFMLGNLQAFIGKYDEAVVTLEDCVLLADEAKNDEIRAKANNALIFLVGWILAYLEEVEPVIKRSKAVIDRLGDNGEIKASWHNNIGLVYYQKGQFDLALAHHQKALKIRERVFGPGHLQVAYSQNSMGSAYCEKGDYNRALEYYRKVLKIREKTLGAEHPELARAHANIGNVLYEKGAYDQAFAHLEKALYILEKSLGARDPDLATSHNNIGQVLYEKRDFDLAFMHLNKALEIWEKKLDSRHPMLAWPLSTIAWLHLHKSEDQRAKVLFERVLSICASDRCEGANSEPLAKAQFGLAKLLWQRGGDRKRALRLAQKAREYFKTKKSVHLLSDLKKVDELLKQVGN